MLSEIGDTRPLDPASAEAWDVRRDQALADRAAWGCPAAGHKPSKPLDPDLAMEAAHAASVMRCEPFDTCPLAEITAAAPWVIEVTEAVALATDWHVPIPETLGRDLTCVDIAALTELKRAQGAALKSDRDIEAANRKKPDP